MSVAAAELAKRAIAFEHAFAVYFPAPAKDMAELASTVMDELGIDYWISPDRRSITCTTCRKGSYNPMDIANLYCGACKKFHRPAPSTGGA